MIRFASLYLLAGLGLLTISVLAAPTPMGPKVTEFKEPKAFFPNRNHLELKGTTIGLLLTEGQQILNLEGRSGPADQLVLSVDGGSYRWVYAQETPAQIGTLTLETLNGNKAFPNLSMCNPRTAKQWGITEGYTLVEVEVNGGDGSPKGDAFAATKMKVIEGTKEFPLKAATVVADAKKRQDNRLKEMDKDLNKALAEVAEKALKGRKATGPKETQTLMYATWMNKEKELHVRFKTTLKDGTFTEVQGGPGGDGPFPLPPAPPRGEKGFRAAPPPKPIAVKVGTAYGVSFGTNFVYDVTGNLIRIETLPIENFIQELNPPPAGGPGPRPRPLPLPVPPVKPDA
jgi:hypothetical protein